MVKAKVKIARVAIGPLSKPAAGLVQEWNLPPQLVNVMAVPTPTVKVAGAKTSSVIHSGAGMRGQPGLAVRGEALAAGADGACVGSPPDRAGDGRIGAAVEGPPVLGPPVEAAVGLAGGAVMGFGPALRAVGVEPAVGTPDAGPVGLAPDGLAPVGLGPIGLGPIGPAPLGTGLASDATAVRAASPQPVSRRPPPRSGKRTTAPGMRTVKRYRPEGLPSAVHAGRWRHSQP